MGLTHIVKGYRIEGFILQEKTVKRGNKWVDTLFM